MKKSVLDYIEKAYAFFPDRTAYQDHKGSMTFHEVYTASKRLGSLIAEKAGFGNPVVVISGKNLQTPVIYLGIAFAGCYYVPVGTELPDFRIQTILDSVQPALIVTDDENAASVKEKAYPYPVLQYEQSEQIAINKNELNSRYQKQLDTDPLYVIFTSGSSGTPKGVVTAHRSVIDYIDVFAKTFNIGQNDVLGNQAPLDYIAAIRDIYLPLHTGAKTVMIQKTLYTTPQKLFEYINENKITTICWVSAALALCSELGVFEKISLDTITKVFFTGSVISCKHLKVWQKNLPDALFVNHYGPTEITASCSYYIVDHLVSDSEILPIGRPFYNSDMFLLSEQGEEVPQGEIGEICIRGTCLALGYFKNPEKTDEMFIQNPFNDKYPEKIYKTGDLGRIDTDGIVHFHGRKDSQIKHMGHRVELGEIESIATSMQKIKNCSCCYQNEKKMIWLFFSGDTDSKEVSLYLRKWLPGYMIPRKFVKLDEMPTLANGKIDIGILRRAMEC